MHTCWPACRVSSGARFGHYLLLGNLRGAAGGGAYDERAGASARPDDRNRRTRLQWERGFGGTRRSCQRAHARVKFHLPDGNSAELLALSIESFAARAAEGFLAFLRAQLPDPVAGPPATDALPPSQVGHVARAFLERLLQKPGVAVYAPGACYAEHIFLAKAADSTSRFGGYRWIPEAAEACLSLDGASQLNQNFLHAELDSRLPKVLVVFRLLWLLADENEPTDDVTDLWSADQLLVELGQLQIICIAPTGAADERRSVFEPSNLANGIALSIDPVPLDRLPAPRGTINAPRESELPLCAQYQIGELFEKSAVSHFIQNHGSKG